MTVRRSGWFLLRARTDRAVYPVLDLYPYATTSPVYVIVGGQPIRSAGDAEYFMMWIDQEDNIYIYGGDFTLRYSYVHDPVQAQNFHIRAQTSVGPLRQGSAVAPVSPAAHLGAEDSAATEAVVTIVCKPR